MMYLVYKLWGKVCNIFNMAGAFPKSWGDFLGVKWFFKGNKKRVLILWRCCCLAIAWCTWQERNSRLFENKVRQEDEVWSRVVFLTLLWAKSSSAFHDFYFSVLASNWAAAIT
ncbi:hypothetical protein LguiA_004603 [Lonicera macranthoides]